MVSVLLVQKQKQITLTPIHPGIEGSFKRCACFSWCCVPPYVTGGPVLDSK